MPGGGGGVRSALSGRTGGAFSSAIARSVAFGGRAAAVGTVGTGRTGGTSRGPGVSSRRGSTVIFG